MLKASFIQSWYCNSFDDAKWESEFSLMKQVGIDTLILADVFELQTKKQGGKWHLFFDCDLPEINDNKIIDMDIVSKVFEIARKHEIKVFIGTGGYNNWWLTGSLTKGIIDFYKTASKICHNLYKNIISNYLDVFAGWYFNPEIANLYPFRFHKNLPVAMNIIIAKLNEITPDRPLMLSPYFNQYMGKSVQKFEDDWTKILSSVNFREFDILAPQDAIGAGWITFDYFDKSMNMYKNAISRSNKKINFWINCENFTQNHKGYPFSPPKTKNTAFIPATMDRFSKQLEYAKKYTNTVITFSYNHYYSKNAVNPGFHNALVYYLEHKKCPQNQFSIENINWVANNNSLKITWSDVKSDWPIISYCVYKNNKFFMHIDTKLEKDYKIKTQFIDTYKKNTIVIYKITATDVFGNISKDAIIEIK